MGNNSSQSYDLAQAQARANEGHREPEEIVSPQDQFCRPVSMASTSSMRKPPKNKTRSKDVDKENMSVASSRAETSSPASLYNDITRESAVDVPKKAENEAPASPVPSERTIEVFTESVLSRAFELEKSELGEQSHVTHVEVKEPEENKENKEEKKVVNEEKERAKVVAEEAVRQVETKRGSIAEEALHKAEEVEKVPLGEGVAVKATERMEEQKTIEEVTRQLDEAIDETTQNEETSVIVQEGSIEYATVSLARDEDISAIETDCIVTEQKLFYTSQLSPALLDSVPSQTHYDKLIK